MSHSSHSVTGYSIRELRERLTDIDVLVAREGEIVITRHGKPIARILPMPGAERRLPSRATLRAKMRRVKVPSERLIREDRDAR